MRTCAPSSLPAGRQGERDRVRGSFSNEGREMGEKKIKKGLCGICPSGCGVEITMKGERLHRIKPMEGRQHSSPVSMKPPTLRLLLLMRSWEYGSRFFSFPEALLLLSLPSSASGCSTSSSRHLPCNWSKSPTDGASCLTMLWRASTQTS